MLKTSSLLPSVYDILCKGDTERPGTGQYNLYTDKGTYCCRLCGCALFRSDAKFISSCGWPSFDDEISGKIKRLMDADGRRTEIRCQQCDGHLGHVFVGEQHTKKNLRHCVNSASIDFVESDTIEQSQEAIIAGGCFWGVEHLLQERSGVVLTEVGYIGGSKDYPSYEEVCSGDTGHIEAVRVVFDPVILSYQDLIKYFLEIHDPTQQGGQGPDRGLQYVSAIFYYEENQHAIAQACLQQLSDKGFDVVTVLKSMSVFWPAEDYHQKYYLKTGKAPYCHIRQKRF